MNQKPTDDQVSVNIFDEIQSLCQDFRHRLKQGESARIEDYLNGVDNASQQMLFQNLLEIDVNYRRWANAVPKSDDYVDRFPKFKKLIRQAFFEPTKMSFEVLNSTPADSVDDDRMTRTFELPAANRLGDYELIRELGRGGFGVVYEARHLKRKDHVALKTLPTGAHGQELNAERLHKFRREFRALSDINHPNLIGMQTLEVDGIQWFFTMDLIDGEDFLSYVRPDDELDEARLRTALEQLVRGVIELHRQGIIHRDLKPSNVLVDSSGRVTILDFGLVAELQKATDQTASLNSAVFAGTPRYVAPEQMFGEKSEASDWYSLGVMIFESLAGEPPFKGTQMELFRQKQNDDPPGLVDRQDLPKDLTKLVDRLLKRKPEERPDEAEIASAFSIELETRSHGSVAESDLDPTVTLDLEQGLIGRQSQLAELAQAKQDLLEKREPIVVFIEGLSGEGKSALAEAFLDPIRQGKEILVLSGRCYDRESVPFKAIDGLIDALVSFLRLRQAEEVSQILPDDVNMLAHLFPILRRVEAVAEVSSSPIKGVDSKQIRSRAFAALRDLMQSISRFAPIIMFVDDLQWGDADSAGALFKLLSPPEPPTIMLLGTSRSDEITDSPFHHEWDRCSNEKQQLLESHVVRVEPLTEQQCVKFLSTKLGQSAEQVRPMAGELFKTTKGNPYFLEQLVTGFDQQAGTLKPIPLNEIIDGKLSKLPEHAAALLDAIAVSGRALPVSEAAQVAGQESPAFGTLAHMRSEQLVRLIGSDEQQLVDTYHDKIRETVLDEMKDDVRRQFHLRFAEVIEAEYSNVDTEGLESESEGKANARVFDLAYHFLEAGDSRAFKYQLRAGEAALDAYAMDNALEHLQKAQELRPTNIDCDNQYRLHFLFGKALSGTGQVEQCVDQFVASIPFAENKFDRAAGCYALAVARWKLGEYSKSMSDMRRAFGELGERLPRSLPGKILGIGGSFLRFHFLPAPFPSRLKNPKPELIKIAQMYPQYIQLVSNVDIFGFVFATLRNCTVARTTNNAEACVMAYGYYASILKMAGVPLFHKRLMMKSKDHAQELKKNRSEMEKYTFGLYDFFSGNLNSSEDLLKEAEQIFKRADDWRHSMAVHFLRHIGSVRGNPKEIIKYSNQEIEIGRQTQDEILIAYGLYGLADGLSRQGDFTKSVQCAQNAIEFLEKVNGTFICMGYQEHGRAQMQASNYADARESLNHAVKLIFRLRFFEITAPSFPLLAEAILGSDWFDQPKSIAGKDKRKAARTAFLARMTGIVLPNNRPHAYRVSGRVAVAKGKIAKAINYFDKAIAAAEKVGAHSEHARSLIDKSVLDYPEANQDRECGLEMLSELGCILPDAECDYLKIPRMIAANSNL